MSPLRAQSLILRSNQISRPLQTRNCSPSSNPNNQTLTLHLAQFDTATSTGDKCNASVVAFKESSVRVSWGAEETKQPTPSRPVDAAPNWQVWRMNKAEAAAFKTGVHSDNDVTLMRFFRCFTMLYGEIRDEEFSVKMGEFKVGANQIVEQRRIAAAEEAARGRF